MPKHLKTSELDIEPMAHLIHGAADIMQWGWQDEYRKNKLLLNEYLCIYMYYESIFLSPQYVSMKPRGSLPLYMKKIQLLNLIFRQFFLPLLKKFYLTNFSIIFGIFHGLVGLKMVINLKIYSKLRKFLWSRCMVVIVF